MKPEHLWWALLALILIQTVAGGGDGQARGPGLERARPTAPVHATAADRHLLAWLVYWEARGEPFEGQVAVAAVVLNRVRHPDFPDSIRGVVFQPGQFQPLDTHRYSASAQIPPNIYQAVDLALGGSDPSMGALFFYNPRLTRNPSFWAGRPVVRKIGNHVFTR
nr:cell wall hydrolase [Limnochorda pilosa]